MLTLTRVLFLICFVSMFAGCQRTFLASPTAMIPLRPTFTPQVSRTRQPEQGTPSPPRQTPHIITTATALVLPPTPTAATAAPTTIEIGKEISMTGVLETVYNGTPHYFLSDGKGGRATLILSEDVTRAGGGPLAFDRKLITVQGIVTASKPLTIRVTKIALAP